MENTQKTKNKKIMKVKNSLQTKVLTKNIRTYFKNTSVGENTSENKTVRNCKLSVDQASLAQDYKKRKLKIVPNQSDALEHNHSRCHDGLSWGNTHDWPGGNNTEGGGPIGRTGTGPFSRGGRTGPIGDHFGLGGLESTKKE